MQDTHHAERQALISTGNQSLTLSDRLAAEGELLKRVPERISDQIKQRWRQAQSDPAGITGEIAGTAAFGCVLGVLTKNPSLLGESLAPAVSMATRYTGVTMLGLSGAELTGKTAGPMIKAWNDPKALSTCRNELGKNLGDAAFDYAVSGIAGGAGFAAGRLPFDGASMRIPCAGLPRLCLADESADAPRLGKAQLRPRGLVEPMYKAQRLDTAELPAEDVIAGRYPHYLVRSNDAPAKAFHVFGKR